MHNVPSHSNGAYRCTTSISKKGEQVKYGRNDSNIIIKMMALNAVMEDQCLVYSWSVLEEKLVDGVFDFILCRR
jgi:hypothetical protein